MKKNEILWGILLGYAGMLIGQLSSLVLTPAFTSSVGLSVYGIYTVVTSIAMFFASPEYGIGTPVISGLVKLRDDKPERGRYLFRILCLYGVFTAAMLLLFSIIFIFTPFLFAGMDSGEHTVFRGLLALMSLNCVVLFAQNYCFSIFSAHERFTVVRVLNVTRCIIRLFLFLAILSFGITIYMILAVELLLNLLQFIAYVFYVRRLDIHIKPHRPEPGSLSSSFKLLFASYIMPVIDNVEWTLTPVIAGMYLAAEDVSRIYIGLFFSLIYYQLASGMSSLRVARMSELHINGEEDGFWAYVFRFGRVQALFMGAVLTGFTVFGPMFLRLWVGSEFTVSYYVGLVTMAGLTLPLTQTMLDVSLYARQRYTGKTVILGARALLIVLLLPTALRLFGVIGAAVLIGIMSLFFRYVVMNIYLSQTKTPVWRYCVRVGLRMLPSVVISCTAGLIIVSLDTLSPLYAVLGTAVSMALYFLLSFFIYLSGDDRRFAIYTAKSFLRRINTVKGD